MITPSEFIHKCEFTCPKCKAVIRPSGLSDTYMELLRKTTQEKTDEIIAECVKGMQNYHFNLHAIEDTVGNERINDKEIKMLKKDILVAVSIGRLEERFGKAKIEFGAVDNGARKTRRASQEDYML